MADFPILKWLDVDGRGVPFAYPQHKKNGTYVETGDENPLPTADYGMTEGGLWIPKRVSGDGAQHTQLTGSNVEDIVDGNFTVEPSATKFITVDVTGYTAFSIGLRRTSGSFKVAYRNRSQDNNWLDGTSVDLIKESNQSGAISDIHQLKSSKVLLYIINTSSTDPLIVDNIYAYYRRG